MKSSIFIATASAALVLANPVEKRDYVVETDVEYAWVTVTVTDGDAAPTPSPSPAAVSAFYVNSGSSRPAHHKAPVVTTTSQAPVPTTSEESDVVIVTITQGGEQPSPTYVAEPVPEPTTAPVQVAAPIVASPEPSTTYAATTEQAESAPTGMAAAAVFSHNEHRSNHSAPELAWLPEIAQYAQNTANSCKFAHDMTQGSGNYGQNIAMWATSDNAAKLGDTGAINMAVHDMWYNGEINQYPGYGGEPSMSNFEGWGHFSQLVWKDTESVGCYAKFCPKGPSGMFDDMDAWYMVCNYRPAGNMGGSYGSNVLKPLGKGTVSS